MRGTSFATPVVAGLLAGSLTEPEPAAARDAVAALAAQAVDLGREGADTTYGRGLVGAALRPAWE
jgi:subtilisin family serine protease